MKSKKQMGDLCFGPIKIPFRWMEFRIDRARYFPIGARKVLKIVKAIDPRLERILSCSYVFTKRYGFGPLDAVLALYAMDRKHGMRRQHGVHVRMLLKRIDYGIGRDGEEEE